MEVARSSNRKGSAEILSQTGSAGSGAPEPAAQNTAGVNKDFSCKLTDATKLKVTEQLALMRDTTAAVCVIAGDTNVKNAADMRKELDRCLSTNWAMVTNCINGRDDFILTLGSPADAGGHSEQFRRKFWAPPHYAVWATVRIGHAVPDPQAGSPVPSSATAQQMLQQVADHVLAPPDVGAPAAVPQSWPKPPPPRSQRGA